MSVRALVAVAALVLAGPVAAQSLAGSYAHQNPDGGSVALEVAMNGAVVQGVLRTATGEFQLQGQLDGANAIGRVIGAPRPLFFQLTPQGSGVYLTLVGSDASGRPDENQLEHYAFERVGSGVAQGGSAGGDPFAGTFAGDALVLRLQRNGSGYRGTATAQGTTLAVEATASGNQLQGSYADASGSYPWTATLAGDVLTMYVDGQTVQLRRGGPTAMAGGGAAPPAPGPSPAAAGALSAQGQEWDQYLRGKRLTQRDSYYSGSSVEGGVGGGYSSRRVLDLCRDGQFAYRDRSTVSASGDGVSGYSGGSDAAVGQWRIIEVQGVVGLELRFQSGEVTQVRLDYQNNQTLLDGTRTFVTADNSSC